MELETQEMRLVGDLDGLLIIGCLTGPPHQQIFCCSF